MEAKKDSDLHQCKVCKEMKARIHDGYFPNANKKYRGEDGILWSGKVCGECNNKRLKLAMKLKRSKSCGSSESSD